MDVEELKKLWQKLGGSMDQDVPEEVFKAAIEFGYNEGWDIVFDEKMDPLDLGYQEWNPQMLAVVLVLLNISRGAVPNFVMEAPF